MAISHMVFSRLACSSSWYLGNQRTHQSYSKSRQPTKPPRQIGKVDFQLEMENKWQEKYKRNIFPPEVSYKVQLKNQSKNVENIIRFLPKFRYDWLVGRVNKVSIFIRFNSQREIKNNLFAGAGGARPAITLSIVDIWYLNQIGRVTSFIKHTSHPTI